MFEVSVEDIQCLDDEQLRTLVARLATAELRQFGKPISGVTAGGDQDAPDGGIDVRIELPNADFAGDFIPRVPLGIQVKKPDMPRAAILNEMKPEGELRSVIGDLADAGGGYIIVSSNGSLADKPLQERRAAIREAVADHPNEQNLSVDFYDRARLAAWVNIYPGVAAWVRNAVGRPLAGWRSLGDWSGTLISGDGRFLFDETACLVDGRSKDQAVLSTPEGIQILRAALAKEGQCLRLLGMSGLGKTRLVQALFESEVGQDPLDPSLALYADYSETPQPTAKQLALELLETKQRTIMVIDNCNPQTHADLAKVCSSAGSKISVITIEYDVRDDEPERTEVFRLQSASSSTLVQWLKANYPHVSQTDRDRIADFSGGNFRVAGVLAETVKRRDSLGDLRDRDLFARIFHQRNDPSNELLSAAEVLSLTYSFEGEDTSGGSELSYIANLAGLQTATLYRHVAELRRRAVIQTRGRWRALLPHAIANRLAAQAYETIPANDIDTFCVGASDRLQKSITRRLGYLHDKEEAITTVERWLSPTGPLGDLLSCDEHSLELLRNLTPVAPMAVLQRIEDLIVSDPALSVLQPRNSGRWLLISILKSLAYDPATFERAALALARILAAERPGENHNSAKGVFEELFHLHLSGTQSNPQQRRDVVRKLYEDSEFSGTICGDVALRALLKSSMFSSTSNFDFGARPRDFGWFPPTYGDIWNWFSDAIDLAVSLGADRSRRQSIREIVASSLRGILGIEACQASIEGAACEFLKEGEWIAGWLAVRSAIRFEKEGWKPEVQAQVEVLEARLRPTDPLNVAKAYVIEARGSGLSLIDGEEDERPSTAYNRLGEKAQEIGREMGSQTELLAQLLPEIMRDSGASRAFSFGSGLATSKAKTVELWNSLVEVFEALPSEHRSATVMGGFLSELAQSDSDLVARFLDGALENPEVGPSVVYLQANVALDESGIARLCRGLREGRFTAHSFNALAYGVAGDAPQGALAELLTELSALEGGTSVALEILHMALYCHKKDKVETDPRLIEVGHFLLMRTDYSLDGDVREYRVQEAIKQCYAGKAGEIYAKELCNHILQLVAERKAYAFHFDHALEALFEVQPLVALNQFLLLGSPEDESLLSEHSMISGQSPLQKVEPEILWQWASVDPDSRYPLLGCALRLFSSERFGDDTGLSHVFVDALERAPDRAQFLARFNGGLGPSGWSGNLSVILERRHDFLAPLADHDDASVREWARRIQGELKAWAARERERETETEETFE